MKETTTDYLLILLALLAPLLLVVLSKWQNSLNTWYIPLHEDATAYFSPSLEQDILALPESQDHQGITLFFIADMNCPCTQATLKILQTTIQTSSKKDIKFISLDIHTPQAKHTAWKKVLQQIPATPTLFISDHNRLVYAGPVTAGNMCTNSVLKILGLSILEAAPQKPVINWLEEGCYCPINPQGVLS
jgi:hypothetical protein